MIRFQQILVTLLSVGTIQACSKTAEDHRMVKSSAATVNSSGNAIPSDEQAVPEDLSAEETIEEAVLEEPAKPYHPPGFNNPAVHGLELKMQAQDCRSCHGMDLTGTPAAPSCDTCHQPEWRSDCTYCHGGDLDATGAPPRGLNPSDPAQRFPAHTAHVKGEITASTQCTQCHSQATDVLSANHVFDGTPGYAELFFKESLSQDTQYSAGGCSNTYCHGNGQTEGSVATIASKQECSSCHASMDSGPLSWGTLSGVHWTHLIFANDCTDCHSKTVGDDPRTIADPTLHINGKADVSFPVQTIRFNPENKSCNGFCHLLGPHLNWPWVLPLPF